MIKNLIKNETAYAGKIKLNFEKHANYYDDNLGVLNKIHLDLGFIKIVSRVMPTRVDENPYELNQSKIDEIQRDTRGIVGIYEWWTIECSCGDGSTYNTTARPKSDKWVVAHNQLPNCFMTRGGEYVGDIEVALWYHKNNLVVNEKNRLVPIKIKSYSHGLDQELSYKKFITAIINNDIIEGFYGYTHKGGQLFKIGDKYFEASYQPKEEDYDQIQWREWTDQFNRAVLESTINNDETEIEELTKEGIAAVIPFNLRGKKSIKSWKKAEEAGINLTAHLLNL